MTTRILPHEEWDKLVGTELERAWPLLDPNETAIVVVEDNGQILGCWAAMRQVHLEGVWVHPDHRGKGRVLARLLPAMSEAVRTMFGARVVWTAAETDTIAHFITDHLGGTELPARHFVLPVGA